MMSRIGSWSSWAAIGAGLLVLAGCGERPPISAVQHGYRGTGMDQVYNPRIVAGQAELNTLPAALPPVPSEGPRAGEIYKNVQVLGNLSIAEFTRNMSALTSWVSPQEGCAYCHNLANLADDSKYTKVVARRMIQMTQHINADWKTHVAGTGVTCYTCHRGNPVPSNVWFAAGEQRSPQQGLLGFSAGQNHPAPAAGLSSLPVDPYTAFLGSKAEEIRVIGPTALATGNRQSTKQAEWTYGLMMHMSSSLGVNCTYCHNSRSFQAWDSSTPQRATAWYGIRMTRDVNVAYIEPLTGTFPAHRLGPTGDVPKVNCGTCHQGAYKPLYGQSLLGAHPELASVTASVTAPAAGATPAAAEAAATVTDSAVVYFVVNSAALPADAAPRLAGVIAALKANPAATVSISGFHSAAGNLASNQDLAKQRALSVREALLAGGVPADRIRLDKPQSAEANLSGEDPNARRVEVALK